MPDEIVTGGASTSALRVHVSPPPVGPGPWPGVVVLHEILGLTDDIRAHTDRLARAGYLAVAPDLYSAGGARRCLIATMRAVSTGSGAALGEIDAVRRWLAERTDCTGRVGVLGFCLGGGFALLAASRGFDAAAVNYGPLPKEPEATLRTACPIVGSYGERDRMMRGAAGKLASTLTEVGVPHDVKEYAGVGHSFLNRHSLGPLGVLERVAGIGHDEAAAQDAWTRIEDFFGRYLR